MFLIRACCCWESLRKGSKGSAVLTFVVGLINFIIDVYGVVFLHHLDHVLEEHEKFTWMMPGIIVFMYIELAFSIGLMCLAFVLNIGINQGVDGKVLIRTWTIGIVVTRCYEIFLGIYVIAWLGGFRVPDIVYMAPEVNLIITYWLLANILLIAALICVRSYWQELLDDLYGQERRTKYYSKLVNIRSANRDRTGATTPMSYWSRSRGPSHAPSHMSLAQPPRSTAYGNPAFSHHPSQSSYQPPSHHPSQSSYGPPSHHPSQSGYQPPSHHPSQSSYHAPVHHPQPHHPQQQHHQQPHRPQPQHNMSQSSYASERQYAPQHQQKY